MPSLEAYQLHLLRADYGLIEFFLLAALAAVVAVLVAKPLSTTGIVSVLSSVRMTRRKLPSLTIEHITVVALILRFPLLFDSFWYDESFTQRLTTLSLAQLPAAIAADTHPPLYYSLMWLWTRFAGGGDLDYGGGELVLRLPSLVYGLLAIYLLYRLVLDLGLGKRVALTAAFLMAITPSALYYSAEARPYALLTCAVFGSLLCLIEDRPKAFLVVTGLIAWLHNLGWLYVIVLCGLALVWTWH